MPDMARGRHSSLEKRALAQGRLNPRNPTLSPDRVGAADCLRRVPKSPVSPRPDGARSISDLGCEAEEEKDPQDRDDQTSKQGEPIGWIAAPQADRGF